VAACSSTCTAKDQQWKKYKCKPGSIVHPVTVPGIKD